MTSKHSPVASASLLSLGNSNCSPREARASNDATFGPSEFFTLEIAVEQCTNASKIYVADEICYSVLLVSSPPGLRDRARVTFTPFPHETQSRIVFVDYPGLPACVG
jgi:hypothetical protein